MISIDKKIKNVQKSLLEMDLDGWLLYDFRRTNEVACRFLEIAHDKLLTRRFFFWIPKHGEPIRIVHQIEKELFEHLPGESWPFATWKQLEQKLAFLLHGKTIAMEYSPRGALPSISKVDAGTMELIKSFEVNVVSSADLLQKFTVVWTKEQVETHFKAAKILEDCVEIAWKAIAHAIYIEEPITEYDVQQLILREFKERQCVTTGGPICAVNANSANAHYEPQKKSASIISEGDWIMLDLWCKLNVPNAVYADITRVAVAAKKPTEQQQEIFDVAKGARDAATDFVRDSFAEGVDISGWEVDKVCRDYIEQAGYGLYFTHRTGHNIDIQDHGDGANIDNFETRDERYLLKGTCFSIEPGIYLPKEFGVRLEYDLYVDERGDVHVTGGIQKDIECLMDSEE